MRQLRTLGRLSPQARSQLVMAYGLLLLVSLAMRWRGLRWTQTTLHRWTHPHPAFPDGRSRHRDRATAIATTTAMVNLAAQYSHPWCNCLRRSLTLWALLHRQGIESQLCIGTRRHQGQLESHAWIEYNHCVLGDRADIRRYYTAFVQNINYIRT